MPKNDPSKNPPAPPSNPPENPPPANPPADPAASEKAKPGKVKVLSEAKRDGKTVQVLTDGVRVWKEAK